MDSKSKLAVAVVIVIRLPPATSAIDEENLVTALWLKGLIVNVSDSASVKNIVETVVPSVVFSLTLPVWFAIIEPAVLVVLNDGAVFGVTRIKIVADDVTNPSDTATGNGCVKTPSPRFVVFKLAVVCPLTLICPLAECIVNLSAV